MTNFDVVNRNHGHWDIHELGGGRIFRVRGAPGACSVIDERGGFLTDKPKMFKTVPACMAYICDTLMFELVATESQVVTRIEDRNYND